MKIRNIILSGALVMGTMWGLFGGILSPNSAEATGSPATIEIPISTVIWQKPVGSEHVLATENVPANLQGYVCDVTATGENQSSVHLYNDLVVATGSDSVMLENVERAPGAITNASGVVTLGSDITVTLVMGQDGIFSAGLTVSFDCDPPVEPPEFTAKVQCTVEDGQAIYRLVINQSNGTSATFDPADGTVLPNGNPISVNATYADSYGQQQVVTETATPSEDCSPVEPPQFTAKVACTFENGQALYKLLISQSSGADATYNPAHGTVLSVGDAIDVTATYVDENQEAQTVTVKAEPSEDCTPPVDPPVFTAHITCSVESGQAVYRLVIKKTGGVDATFSPANGTILDSGESIDVTATYTDTDEVQKVSTIKADPTADCSPQVLPSTGIGSVMAGLFGFTGLGTGISSWMKSRRAIKAGLLN